MTPSNTSASKKKAQLLADIRRLEGELDAVLDEYVAQARKENPDIPEGSHRHMITRGNSCLCRVVASLLEQDKKQAA